MILKMAVIEGQIEQLKKLKETLEKNRISRFGSIAEINNFIKNYEAEKNEIPKVIEKEFDAEIEHLRIDLSRCQQSYDDLKSDVEKQTNQQIRELKEALTQGRLRIVLEWGKCALSRIRTCDFTLRRGALYPAELPGQNLFFIHLTPRVSQGNCSVID